MNLYIVAETLHKTVSEVQEMSCEEFDGWLAFFSIKEKERKKQEARSKAKTQRR